MRIRFYILALVIAATAAFFPHIYVHAQATASDVLERRATLEKELATIEAEIEEQRKILVEQQRQTATLERDVAIINAKIQSAELSIRARRLEIQKLGTEISNKADTIIELNAKIKREKESLGQLLRKTHEIDSYSLVEVVLAN